MCSTRLPKLIAFDLDYTLWDLWIDTHVDGPLHRKAQRVNEVLDRNDHPISFYRDVADIFHKIRAHRFADEGDAEDKVVIAVCSRTHAPDLARQCLNLLLVPPPHNSEAETAPPTAAITFFDELEIYPGNAFFDDERRNGEVEKLGVTFIHVPTGLNHKIFEDGLERWQKRRSDS
ncbi:hypothetical protein FA13DRAFT_1858052 [Coprinellus micaceus]|uniref:Magnesium-dependent phosphatase-1 n=1 Tax=Coprinellus micaceus TaxID=71717 RepID=A0A4Y7SBH0_COPMI|nr:hypothetical protein FA13DRAFT_1858052 [Coprinellus micaceus]